MIKANASVATLAVTLQPPHAPAATLVFASANFPQTSLVEGALRRKRAIGETHPTNERVHAPITRKVFDLRERLGAATRALHIDPRVDRS